MNFRAMGLATAIALAALAPEPVASAGVRPFAWISILDGLDAPLCGEETSPCRTALYAKRYIVRPGAPIFVADAGHFGEPAFFTMMSLMAEQLGGRLP